MNTSKKNFEPLKHWQLLLNKQIQSIKYIWEIVKLVSTSKSISTSISTEATLSMNWDSIFRDLGRTVQIHFYKSQSGTWIQSWYLLRLFGPAAKELFSWWHIFFRKQQFFLHFCCELANVAKDTFFALKTAGADFSYKQILCLPESTKDIALHP